MNGQERQTAGITTSLIARYVRSVGGDEALEAVLQAAGETRGAAALEDETGWSTYDQKIRLFEAASRVLHDHEVARHVGETVLRQSAGAGLKVLLRALGTPGQVLRNIARAAPKFTTVGSMEALEVGRNDAVVTYRLLEGFEPSRFDCDYNIGLMSQVSVLFGRPPALVEHGECQVEGAPACIYRVSWVGGRRFRSTAKARVRHLEDQVTSLAERTDALQMATADIVSADDVDTVLSRIAGRAAHAVHAQAFLLAVHLTPGGHLHVHHEGLDRAQADELAQKLLNDDLDDPEGSLVVEVASARSNYGRLAALHPKTGGFFWQEKQLLSSYARHAAAALDAATALAETRAQERKTRVLLELAGSLAQASTRDEIARRLVDSVPKLVGGDRSIVYLWDEGTETLHARATYGYDDDARDALLQLVFKPGDMPIFISPDTLLRPQYFNVDEIEDEIVRQYMIAYGAQESFVVPITARGEPLGIITSTSITGSRPLDMDESMRQRMIGLADQAATALENVRLLEQERATVERLREANAFKSQFLGVVSHELRTPLAAIMGMARTLSTRNEQIDEAVRKEFLDAIVERGEQLGRLVDDLLHSSRDMELRPMAIDLAQLAGAAINTARQLAPSVKIQLDAPDRIPVVLDGGRLRQVLDNLLINAVRYAPGSPIEVAAGRRNVEYG